MSEIRLTVTQRRQLIKRRARALTGMFYFRLIAVLAVYLFPFTMLSGLFSGIAFGGPSITLFGAEINLLREIFQLLLLFLEAPLLLASCEYMLSIDNEKPRPFLSVFSWLGEGRRLYAAAQYALFNVCLHIVLFPLDRFPRLWVQSRQEEYTGALNVIMDAAQTHAQVDVEAINAAVSFSSAFLFCVLLTLLASFLSLFFAPLPYLAAEDADGATGIISKIRMSVACIRGHVLEFALLLITFAGWFLLASLLSDYLAVIFYPYIYMSQTVFLNRLIRAKRRKDTAGSTEPPVGPENPEEPKD